jgi:hypothetical protein
MALYKVNTGCWDQEVRKLRWDWEIRVPDLNTTVFLIPAGFGGRSDKAGVKNGDERLVILNRVAMNIIDSGVCTKTWCSRTGSQISSERGNRTNERLSVEEGQEARGGQVGGGSPVTGASRVQDIPGSRLEAHFWQKSTCSRRDRGGSATDYRGPALTILRRKS